MPCGPILRFDGDFIVDGVQHRIGSLSGIDRQTAKAAERFGWRIDDDAPAGEPHTVTIVRYATDLPPPVYPKPETA